MTGGFAVTGIDHVVLRVLDLPAMLGFYRDTLGLAVEREQPELGLTQLRAGRSLIDLITVAGPLGRVGGGPPASNGRNVDHFALGVSAWDEGAIRRFLMARGVKVLESGQRYGATGHGPSLYVADPEGNVVELKGGVDGH